MAGPLVGGDLHLVHPLHIHSDPPELQGLHHSPRAAGAFQGLGVPDGPDLIRRGEPGVVHRNGGSGAAHFRHIQQPFLVDGQGFRPGSPQFIQQPQQIVIVDHVQVGILPGFGGHLAVVHRHHHTGSPEGHLSGLDLQVVEHLPVPAGSLSLQFFQLLGQLLVLFFAFSVFRRSSARCWFTDCFGVLRTAELGGNHGAYDQADQEQEKLLSMGPKDHAILPLQFDNTVFRRSGRYTGL